MLIYINFSFDFLSLDNVDFENYSTNKLIRWVVFKPFSKLVLYQI